MAQLKNTTINDTGTLDLPSGTTAQRPSSPIQGMIRFNTTIGDTEYYDGGVWRPISDSNPEATGGTIVDTDIGGVPYRIHIFKNTGNSNFVVTKGGEVEYLIVAGGGSGGTTGGGGGGAGGVLTGNINITPQTYNVVVGTGGARATGWNNGLGGANGQNSSVMGLTAIGGGHGGDHPSYSKTNGTVAAKSGGSGGGGRQSSGGSGTSGQGNNGGNGTGSNGHRQGGGGGAGSPGERGEGSGTTSNFEGNGGVGLSSFILGITNFYAGGGGTGWYSASGANADNVGKGGLGGGGNGGFTNLFNETMDGTPNTGSGGGGGGYTSSSATTLNSGQGGSGIVIIRYRRNVSTATNPNSVLTSFLPYNYARDVRPIIVRDGLVLDLDAANPLSYPGTGTTWTDLSGNGNNGTLINGPTFDSGNLGSISFDGINDYVSLSSPSNKWAWTPSATTGYNVLSIEMWTKSTDTSGRYFSRPWNGSGEYNYWLTADGWYQQIGNQSSNRTFTSLATGNWEHIVCVVTATQSAVYRNGIVNQNFSSHNITNNTPASGNSNLPLAIMTLYPYGSGWGGDTGHAILGSVSNFKIYNRVLSPEEVLQNFNATRGRYGI